MKYILLLLALSTSVQAICQPLAGKPSLPLAITADDLVNRVKSKLSCDWDPNTVDTYKGGDGTMQVTGIATTFLATLEVLKKAKAKGLNLIITHEPTFYNHFDNKEPFENDAIFMAKQKYIEENGLIVWRFHDHWHRTTPDGIYQGIVGQMNWSSFEVHQTPYIYKIPNTTLKKLADRLKAIFGSKTIRVVGNPNLKVTDVGMVLGAAGSKPQIESLQRPDVQVLLIGETHEWETVEYVRDAMAFGKEKALVLLGHANSEEAGMKYCAEWLKTFVSEVPVEFVPAGDPFWGAGKK